MSHVSCQEVKTKNFAQDKREGCFFFGFVCFWSNESKRDDGTARILTFFPVVTAGSRRTKSKTLSWKQTLQALEGFKSQEVQNLASNRCWWYITLIKSPLICSRYTRVVEQWSTKRHVSILILKCEMMHGDLGRGHVRFKDIYRKNSAPPPKNRLMSPGRWGEVDEPRKAAVMEQSLSEGGLPGTQRHLHRNLGCFAVGNAFRSRFCYKGDGLVGRVRGQGLRMMSDHLVSPPGSTQGP